MSHQEEDLRRGLVEGALALARKEPLGGLVALALLMLVDCRRRERGEERDERLVDTAVADGAAQLIAQRVERGRVLLAIEVDDRVEDLVHERHRREVGRPEARGSATAVLGVDAVGKAPGVARVPECDIAAGREEHVVEARGEVSVTSRLPCVHGAHLALSGSGAHAERHEKMRQSVAGRRRRPPDEAASSPT